MADETAFTRLLETAAGGDAGAAAALVPEVYEQLRELARARMARLAPGNTLQPTALVHEAFLRLMGHDDWRGQSHFFAASARAMGQILVDQARKKGSAKHGGGRRRVEVDAPIAAPSGDVLAVAEAIDRLEEIDGRKADIARLRCLVGLTEAETASALGVSAVTVRREWRFVKPFIRKAVGDDGAGREG